MAEENKTHFVALWWSSGMNPTTPKIEPGIPAMETQSTTSCGAGVRAFLATLPDPLILCVSDFCDLNGLEALSLVCRKMYGLVRIRPLEPPPRGEDGGGEKSGFAEFAILPDEVRVVLRRMDRIQNESSSSACSGNNNNDHLLDWGAKICGALVSRYGKDNRLIAAKETANHEAGEEHTYWRLRRAIDIVADATTATKTTDDAIPYFLYYWDDRDGPHWEGWWITPHSVGFTRHHAFSRGQDGGPEEPHECRRWQPSSLRVVREVDGEGGVLVRNFRTTWNRMAPYEGHYAPIESDHHHGGENRRVYKKSQRELSPCEKHWIASKAYTDMVDLFGSIRGPR